MAGFNSNCLISMRNQKLRFILIYNSIPVLVIRVLLINVLIFIFFYNLFLGNFLGWVLALISLFIIFEVFFKFNLEKIEPFIEVSNNKSDIFESFTKSALQSIFYKKNTEDFLRFILNQSQSDFFLKKAVIEKEAIKISPVTPEALSKKAFEIARISDNKFVSISEILCAYLLLTEGKTKLLFSNKLKEKDILNINMWTKTYFKEDKRKSVKVRISGNGIYDSLVFGWTPETKKYTKDLSFSNMKVQAFIEGREKEYQLLLEVMQKNEFNNAILVGKAGIGKDNLVENLIHDSNEGLLPKKLNHKRFLELMVGQFVAGANNRNELETRLQNIIEEVSHSGNVILYIPEFQNLIGSGAFDIDLSGAIFPYLKDGRIPIIASVTPVEYKKYFENNALREVFEIITLEEPSENTLLKMLFQKTGAIEKESRVVISYKAVLAALEYSGKYGLNEVLPGASVDLLSDCANAVKLSKRNNQTVLEEDVMEKVSKKSHIPVGVPEKDEKTLLLNLENEMHKSIIGQDEAVREVSEAIRRIRAGITREKPISFLFLGPTGVGKTETAKTLSRIYFGGEAHIIRLDMSEYASLESLHRLLQSDSGSFLDSVSAHPFSLILLDEFEKANEKILNLFLQVFDDGRLTDNNSKTVSFTNTIIIATSNAGGEFIRESLAGNIILKSSQLLDYLEKKAVFSPELLNRFDQIVMFKPLSLSEIAQVTKLLLTELIGKMNEKDVVLTFDQNAIEKIASSGFNEEFGARHLRRFIQDNIEDIIAQKLISGEIVRGNKVMVSFDPSLNLVISKQP